MADPNQDLIDYVNRQRGVAGPSPAATPPTPAGLPSRGGDPNQDLIDYANKQRGGAGGAPAGTVPPPHSVTPATDHSLGWSDYNLGQKVAFGTAGAIRIASGLATIPTEAFHAAPGVGTAAKAAIGAGIGFGSDAVAQYIEIAAGLRPEGFSKTEAGVAAGLMAIPLGEIPRSWRAGAAMYRALQGAGLGAAATQAVPLIEHGKPASLTETAIGAGVGGVFAGGAQKVLGWRQARAGLPTAAGGAGAGTGEKLHGPPIPHPGTEGFVPPGTARVGAVEPIINKIGYDYKFDPADNRWKAVNKAGEPFDTLYPERSDPTKRLVDELFSEREKHMAGVAKPVETGGGEKDAIKEREIAEGGEPEHIGVSRGKDVSADVEEVRTERSEQAGDRGGAGAEEEISLADTLAEKAHKGKTRKFSGEPYIEHPREVASSVRPGLRPAALLHDAVEDGGITIDELRSQGVSEQTINLIDSLTRRPGESYADYITRVGGNPDATEIKLADLKANLSTLPEGNTLKGRYTKAIENLTAKAVGKLGEAGPAVSPYFIEKHGDNYAVFERTTPEGKPSNRIMLNPTTLAKAQERKALLDTDYQAVQKARAQGRNPPPRDYSGSSSAGIANRRRALMYGLETPDNPDWIPEPTAPSPAAKSEAAPRTLEDVDADIKALNERGELSTPALVKERRALLDQQQKDQTAEKAAAKQPAKPIDEGDVPAFIEGAQHPPSPDLPRPQTPVYTPNSEDTIHLNYLKMQSDRLGNIIGRNLTKKPTKMQRAAMKELWDGPQSVFAQIHAIQKRIGLRRDVVAIGWGPYNLTVVNHIPYERGPRSAIIGKGLPGGQSAKSQEIINVAARDRGVKGRQFYEQQKRSARNRGVDFIDGDVVDMKYANGKDGSDGVDVYIGERDANGFVTKITDVIPTWRVSLGPGARVQRHVRENPFFELAGWGDSENLNSFARGNVVATYGSGNAATQAIFGAIDAGAKKVVVISRNKFELGSDASGNQKDRLEEYEKDGIVEFVTGQITNIKEGKRGERIIHTKGNPPVTVAHIENFLDSTMNTDWLPANFRIVPFKDKHGNYIPLNKKPGRIRVINEALQSDMEGVYVGGDARGDVGPLEKRARRIDTAKGDGGANGARIVSDLAYRDKHGRLPEWDQINPSEHLTIDQSLKELKTPTITGATTPTSQAAASQAGSVAGPQPRQSWLPLTRSEPTSKPSSTKKTPSAEPGSSKPGLTPTEIGPTATEPKKGYGKATTPEQAAPGYGTTHLEDPEAVKAQAEARVEGNPAYTDKLVTDLHLGKKVAPDAPDELLLTQRRASRQDARDRAGERAMDETLSDAERAEAASNFEDLDAQVRLLDDVTDNGEILKGRQTRLLWHQFRARDYDLPAMEQKLTVAKGGKPVSAEEKAALKVKTDRLTKAMVDVENIKVRTGWRPGLGEKVGPGVRHEQHLLQLAKDDLDNTIFKATRMTKGLINRSIATGREVTSLARSAMTAADLSAVRRQGGLFFMSHPLRSIKLMGDMLRAAKSPEAYFTLMQDIRERPNAELYLSSKLGLTEIKTPKLSQLEEFYGSRWADKIPVINHSQRAYVYFLNRLRADSFDTMAKNLGRNGVVTAKQARGLSNFINVWTGRGEFPEKYAQAAIVLNEAFFAPRYILSRFQALTGQPFWGKAGRAAGPEVRKLIAAEYARTLRGYAALFGLVAAAGYKIETDWRSTDFGKLVIGDTHIDFLSGLAQPTVLVARSLPELGAYLGVDLPFGNIKTAQGRVQSLSARDAPFSQRTYGNVLFDFMRSKLAPMPAAYLNVKMGKKVTGEETTVWEGRPEWMGGTGEGSEILSLVTPLSMKDIFNAMKEHGTPTGVALSLLAFFGDSVNTYATKGKPARRPHPHK